MICLVIWCCPVEFLWGWVHLHMSVSSVVIVIVFVFVWVSCLSISLSWCSRLVRRFCFCVRLHVVVSFVIFMFVFIFARLRSQMDEWVSWLPKPILVCLRVVLLGGGAA